MCVCVCVCVTGGGWALQGRTTPRWWRHAAQHGRQGTNSQNLALQGLYTVNLVASRHLRIFTDNVMLLNTGDKAKFFRERMGERERERESQRVRESESESEREWEREREREREKDDDVTLFNTGDKVIFLRETKRETETFTETMALRETETGERMMVTSSCPTRVTRWNQDLALQCLCTLYLQAS